MEPTERWQPIAPASDEPGQQRPTPDAKKRRQAIAVACLQCRSGKVKCDGARPRCTRCSELDLLCRFDVAEGVSRAERMKLLKRESMSGRAEEMQRVITALRTGSDDQASAILARLRIGDRLNDVLKELPSSVSSPVVSNPSSSLVQGTSVGIYESHANTESAITLNNSRNSLYALDSRPPQSSTLGQRSDPSSSRPITPAPRTSTVSIKGKQIASTFDATIPPFLVILFDREDYLRGINETEGDDDLGRDTEGFIDPRLLTHATTFDAADMSIRSPVYVPRSQHLSPRKEKVARYHGLTPLHNRQPTVNTIRIHPNLNLHNLFGNMPFSSSVRANNYPADIQDVQVGNLFLPTWAMMTVSTRPDPGSLKVAFQGLYQRTAAVIEDGMPLEAVIEAHPNIAALFNEDEYNRSGVLSKWAAGMVHSAQLKGNDFTAFASMYIVWYLGRWMVSPSPGTYETMPDWLRPTPNQLFMPHIHILDFILWPAFREYAVEMLEMQEHMEYMMDMSNNLLCDWYLEKADAFQRVEETGMLDLSDMAKTTLRDLTSWSLGPSFRQYVTNADAYVRIRAEGF